jgi:uncharacterized protein (TIRG00374 family)
MSLFKKALSLFLRILVSAVLLFLLFKLNKIDLLALLKEIKNVNRWFLALALLVFPLSHIIGFWRWQMLLKSTVSIPMKKLVSTFCGGVFFNVFLPSTIGGDLVRMADLTSHTRRPKEIIASVFLDRLSGYIGMVMVILLAVIFGGSLVHDKIVLLSVAAITLLLIGVLLLLFNASIYARISKFLSVPGAGRIREAIRDMHREIHIFRNHKEVIIGNLALSFVIQIVFPLSIYFIGLSLGIRVSLFYYLIFVPIINAITMLPVSMGGLGLRESLYVLYFAKAGVAEQLALAMSLLFFSFIVLYGAIGGVIYVFTIHHRRLQHNQPPLL